MFPLMKNIRDQEKKVMHRALDETERLFPCSRRIWAPNWTDTQDYHVHMVMHTVLHTVLPNTARLIETVQDALSYPGDTVGPKNTSPKILNRLKKG